jgi:hypothetical protein
VAIHPNALLLERLFAALHHHDAGAMAACYADDALKFHDIAFHIESKPRLYGMWRMVCEGESDIHVKVNSIEADGHGGEARIIDTYRFGREAKKGKEGRPVVNEIVSRFRFRDGLICEQIDSCDERAWADQAIGGPLGWVAGRIRLVRSLSANRKLDRFLREHPVPAPPPPRLTSTSGR